MSTKIEIPVKFNMIRPTHKSSKVSSKLYLGNANRVLHKDVLKPCSIATYNLIHKAAKIPHVKLDIHKPSNNQPPTLSQNVIRSLRLNTHKQPSPANIHKPSRNVTKLSHLKTHNPAHQKLLHDGGAYTKNVSANHLRYKWNLLWWKYHSHQKKKKNLSSYLREFLLLLIFFSNNFDFICNNNKQLYFVKMQPTMSNKYFLLVIVLTNLSK